MSKTDEKKLEKILKNLKRFVNRREGHALVAMIYPPTDQEAKGVYVAGDWVHYLTVGNKAIPLDLIHSKFYKELKKFEERDREVVRDMERRRRAEK